MFEIDFGIPPIMIGSVVIPFKKIFILVTSLILMVALSLFVTKTYLGKAMRATAADREAAEMMGISSNAVIVLKFVVGSSLGAVAGILYAINYNSIDPYMGFNAGMKAFAAAVLGGIGNIYGAMLGGLLLGIFEGAGAAYVSSMYRDAVAFAILILALILRPEGLLGEFKSGENSRLDDLKGGSQATTRDSGQGKAPLVTMAERFALSKWTIKVAILLACMAVPLVVQSHYAMRVIIYGPDQR